MLNIDNVSKKYKNGIYGIKDFSLDVNDGEIVCVAGPNGSGKTTLFSCVTDVLDVTEGEITFDGIGHKSVEYKEKISYASDDVMLIEELTGREYISFVSNMYALKDKSKAEALTELFSMQDALGNLISSYSHGMKKKVQLISTFMLDVELIVLDEPTRGLDVESIISLKKLMRRFVQKGNSILVATHDLISVEQYCDRVCIISEGIKVAQGTPEELKAEYEAENLEEVFMKSSICSQRGQQIEEIISSF